MLKKSKVVYYIIDTLIMGMQVFFGIAAAVQIYNLFQADYKSLTLVFTFAILVYLFGMLKNKNGRLLAKNIARDLAYKRPSQAAYDLQRGDLLCFLMNDEYGTIKIIEDEIVMFLQNKDTTLGKDIEKEGDVLDFITDLMQVAQLYANGIIFTAEVVAIPEPEQHLSFGNKIVKKEE